MKHLISPIANGGAPIYLDDLINSDLQNKQAYEAILAGLDDKIILSGCEVTVTGPGSADITAGFVYLNGTVMEIPSPYSGVYPVYIHEATAVNDTRDFEDGNTDIVATTRSAEFTGTPSGDNIEINPTSGYYLSTVIKRASYELEDIKLVHITSGKFDGTGLGLDYNVERGFALCNGSNGTPDLRGTFIVGLGTGDYASIGNTGGEETHLLTQGELPDFNLPYTINKDNNAIGSSGYFASSTGGGTAQSSNLSVNSGGNDEAHENRPPYYVLAYVMKVS
jgi:hypothetical protein